MAAAAAVAVAGVEVEQIFNFAVWLITLRRSRERSIYFEKDTPSEVIHFCLFGNMSFTLIDPPKMAQIFYV